MNFIKSDIEINHIINPTIYEITYVFGCCVNILQPTDNPTIREMSPSTKIIIDIVFLFVFFKNTTIVKTTKTIIIETVIATTTVGSLPSVKVDVEPSGWFGSFTGFGFVG